VHGVVAHARVPVLTVRGGTAKVEKSCGARIFATQDMDDAGKFSLEGPLPLSFPAHLC
jgi:hypothetical protein